MKWIIDTKYLDHYADDKLKSDFYNIIMKLLALRNEAGERIDELITTASAACQESNALREET